MTLLAMLDFLLTVVPSRSYTESGTSEHDRMAMKYLSWALYPIVIGYSIYSLYNDEHKGWYSFILSTLTGTVYTFGFITMCPQVGCLGLGEVAA